MVENNQTLKEHRVIGIRHTLKAFKEVGLIDDDTMYPDRAVDKIKDDMLQLAYTWYQIGARRGALEILEAFLNGEFEINKKKNKKIEVIANVEELSWKRRLNITVGNDKKHINSRKYKLKIKKDLKFY